MQVNYETWSRASFRELFAWVENPPVPRAILLSGARQVGKTTLILQTIDALLKKGVAPANLLYVTFDHPIIKMAGVDAVIQAWREREPRAPGQEFLFLDEAQFMRDWGTWIKHQVDFFKDRRIVFTGSAMPLLRVAQESGVGRWHTIKLTTLSFYEYLQIRHYSFKNTDKNKVSLPSIPQIKSLRELFDWPRQEFYRVADLVSPYVGHFHEYLLRGGFPQTAQMTSIHQAQRLLREDIIDKVLKRDMTALFGVRRVLDLEHTFLYLCMHEGGLLDLQTLCENLEVNRPTSQKFIELLEATHLIYRLQPYGYGKEILRAKYKAYMADAAIAPAILLKGKSTLENSESLGIVAETAVFKHLYSGNYPQDVRFTYWHGKNKNEVDIIIELDDQLIPLEIKYRAQQNGLSELKGLLEICNAKLPKHAFVIIKSIQDFGLLEAKNVAHTKIMQVPAPLLCYWKGESELLQTNFFE